MDISFLPENGSIVKDRSNFLGAMHVTDTKKKLIFVKSIASSLSSESKLKKKHILIKSIASSLRLKF